ncbi:hypothetical protein EAF00_000395 [Botryotinia globosa]|nr:hypothetical protein EAF00_000395 [Botryotinia globosa]
MWSHSPKHLAISPPISIITPSSILRQNACSSTQEAQSKHLPVSNVRSPCDISYPQPACIRQSMSRARSLQEPATLSLSTNSTPSPPPRYSLFPSPSTSPSTPSSTLPMLMQRLSCRPCAHEEISGNASLKIHEIFPSHRVIVIEVAFQHFCIPINLVMLHPVGHFVLLRSIHTMGQWRQYLALWRQTLWLSAGGLRRLQLEYENGYWIIQNTDGMCSCARKVAFTDQSIGSTWEGRALLAWERNILFFFWEITCAMMKGLFTIFIRFVYW